MASSIDGGVRMLRFVQSLFFLALCVVVISMVIPAAAVPDTFDISDKILHFIAYFGLGLLGGTGWPERRYSLIVTMPLFGMVLEFVQGGFVPGRSFDWFDGLANAFGAFAGIAASYTARKILFASS